MRSSSLIKNISTFVILNINRKNNCVFGRKAIIIIRQERAMTRFLNVREYPTIYTTCIILCLGIDITFYYISRLSLDFKQQNGIGCSRFVSAWLDFIFSLNYSIAHQTVVN